MYRQRGGVDPATAAFLASLGVAGVSAYGVKAESANLDAVLDERSQGKLGMVKKELEDAKSKLAKIEKENIKLTQDVAILRARKKELESQVEAVTAAELVFKNASVQVLEAAIEPTIDKLKESAPWMGENKLENFKKALAYPTTRMGKISRPKLKDFYEKRLLPAATKDKGVEPAKTGGRRRRRRRQRGGVDTPPAAAASAPAPAAAAAAGGEAAAVVGSPALTVAEVGTPASTLSGASSSAQSQVSTEGEAELGAAGFAEGLSSGVSTPIDLQGMSAGPTPARRGSLVPEQEEELRAAATRVVERAATDAPAIGATPAGSDLSPGAQATGAIPAGSDLSPGAASAVLVGEDASVLPLYKDFANIYAEVIKSVTSRLKEAAKEKSAGDADAQATLAAQELIKKIQGALDKVKFKDSDEFKADKASAEELITDATKMTANDWTQLKTRGEALLKKITTTAYPPAPEAPVSASAAGTGLGPITPTPVVETMTREKAEFEANNMRFFIPELTNAEVEDIADALMSGDGDRINIIQGEALRRGKKERAEAPARLAARAAERAAEQALPVEPPPAPDAPIGDSGKVFGSLPGALPGNPEGTAIAEAQLSPAAAARRAAHQGAAARTPASNLKNRSPLQQMPLVRPTSVSTPPPAVPGAVKVSETGEVIVPGGINPLAVMKRWEGLPSELTPRALHKLSAEDKQYYAFVAPKDGKPAMYKKTSTPGTQRWKGRGRRRTTRKRTLKKRRGGK